MPIRLLDNYLAERKLTQTLPLTTLSDSRLGIDAAYYINTLLDSPATREPLLAATGGAPLTLTTKIEADLRALDKLRIKPVFVFPGLTPNKRQRPTQSQEHITACHDRKEAWSKYENGQEDLATKLFDGRSCLQHWDVWRMVLRIFRHRNVEFMVAPYVAWAQLIYLLKHPKAYIHAIYASSEALLYPGGTDKVITSLDITSNHPSFTFIAKPKILSDLSISEDQFLDVSILAGFDYSPTFPPVSHEFSIKSTVDMVKYYKTGFATVSNFGDHPTVKAMSYIDHFARTRTMVKFSVIFSSDGVVLPLPLAHSTVSNTSQHGHPPHHLTAADIPTDFHEVFSHRLPDEIHYYVSRGLIGPQCLNWLTSGYIFENPPLDTGETTEYRRFVKEVITEGQTGPRATALALVSSVTHSFWSNRRVQGCFWFEPTMPTGKTANMVGHNSRETATLAERVAGWNVPYALIEEELRRQNSSTIDFSLILGATSTEKLANRTRNRSSTHSTTLDKKDEIVANVIFRFMELRGFLLNSHMHTALARAMHLALKPTRVNDKFQDPLYLFLELARAGVLHGNLWSGRAYSGGPSFGTDDEKKCMLLVMRVLSILPLSFKSQPWQAPLSRELLVFNSFVRSLTRALRNLLEITALNMLLRGDARRAREDLLDIALSLPFQNDVNTGFGVLIKVYLDTLTHLNGGQRVLDGQGESISELKAMALDLCEETFPGVKNPRAEVERGFRFWDGALMAIRTLVENGVLPELADVFEMADAWLKPHRP